MNTVRACNTGSRYERDGKGYPIRQKYEKLFFYQFDQDSIKFYRVLW